ncbi:MFS transporter [Candidatus Saccharibacteria bacterium]|nr:MFS transporter [Candidatus Saccharibacteria bacterium]
MKKSAGYGLILFALSLAQFIMTVDTTIMNVSVPTLVDDLNTTVGYVQTAITLYALVMASLMLVGGKLGEIFGRKKMFQLGLVIYAIGSLTTAVAPNIGVLIFGWSFLEGIGAALMMPAMMALISVNFKGKQRVAALGVVAGVAGAAAALGPIIGGALSTYASWRYAFIGEVVIALLTLILSKNILDAKISARKQLDYKGSLLAVTGLALLVFGILQISTYGLIKATRPFEIAGYEIDLFGLSIAPFLIGIGAIVIWLLFKYERRLKDKKQPYLLNIDLFKVVPLRSGLSVVLITQLTLAGTLFVMPLFLQLVLGYSAMKSGVALLPISVALIGFSAFGQKITKGKSAIESVRIGQTLLFMGLILLLFVVGNDTEITNLIIPFLFMGAGIGLIIPFIQTVILGSVKASDSSQAAGLNYTYQQLGTSLGTALVGGALLFSLGSGIVKGLGSSEQFDQSLVEQNSVQISNNVEFVSNAQLESALDQSNYSDEQKNEILFINSEARIRSIRTSLGVAAVALLISFGASGKVKDAYSIKSNDNLVHS